MGAARDIGLVMRMSSSVSRRRFLQLAGGSVAATMLSDSIARALADPGEPRDPFDQGRRAHRVPDAGEPVVRPLLRHDARRARVRRSAPGDAAQRQAGLAPGRRRRPSCRRSGPTSATTSRSRSSRTSTTAGTGHTRCSTAATGTSGCRPRRPRAWRTWSAPTCPFHYALADAFTVCDGNYCSMLGPTDTNRYYMWTGWDGNDGKGGGPVIANDEIGYDWTTYPERLQAGRDQLEDLPGQRRRARQSRGLGLDVGSVHRQLRRQLAAVLPPVPERGTGQPALPAARTGTDVVSAAPTSTTATASSTSSPTTSSTAGCRACPGSSPPRPTPSIRRGPQATAPGTPPTCSTPSPATPRSGPRPP